AGPGGNIMGPRNFWHGFMLSSTVAESENFLAILQFLDWLYFAPEAREMLRWGIEGETCTKAEDGRIELTEGHSLDAFDLNTDAETDILKDLGFSTFLDRKSTRLNSSHVKISYAVFCLKKKNTQ